MTVPASCPARIAGNGLSATRAAGGGGSERLTTGAADGLQAASGSVIKATSGIGRRTADLLDDLAVRCVGYLDGCGSGCRIGLRLPGDGDVSLERGDLGAKGRGLTALAFGIAACLIDPDQDSHAYRPGDEIGRQPAPQGRQEAEKRSHGSALVKFR